MFAQARWGATQLAVTGLAIAGVFSVATTGVHGSRRDMLAASTVATAKAAPVLKPQVRICVTSWGVCPIPTLRNGDPCSCPHPLRGSVRGKVQSAAMTPAPMRVREPSGDLTDLPLRLGPRRDD